MKRYRYEAYTKEFTLFSYGSVSTFEIIRDYMTDEKSSITVPGLVKVNNFDYLVLKENSNAIYVGVISSYEYKDGTTEILCNTLNNALLDYNVFIDTEILKTLTLEQVIAGKLTDKYAGTDTYQNLTGFSISYDARTMVNEIDTDRKSVQNLLSLIRSSLSQYEIIVTWTVDIGFKTIHCHIGHIDTDSIYKVKTTVADVIESKITVGMNVRSLNKIKYYNSENTAESITYYLHSDGSIDTDSVTDRIIPVQYEERTAQGKTVDETEYTYAEVALNDAESAMALSEFDNQIVLTIRSGSKVIPIGEIGQVYRIIDDEGTLFRSILTAVRFSEDSVPELTFGTGRGTLISMITK